MDLEDYDLDADDDESLDDLLSKLSGDEKDTDSILNSGHPGEEASGDGDREGFEWLTDQLDENGSSDPLDPAFDADHVLVLAPLRRQKTEHVCYELCTPSPAHQMDVLIVSLTRTSEDLIEDWQNHEPVLPGNLALLCAGDEARSTDAGSTTGGPDTMSQVTVKSMPDPSDLTRMGLSIVKILNQWEDTPNQTAICVHSITAFLQYVDPQRLFRFFHLLQARIDHLDGIAHYHMDPSAHDDQTIGIFRTLFDTIVRIDDDDSITVED